MNIQSYRLVSPHLNVQMPGSWASVGSLLVLANICFALSIPAQMPAAHPVVSVPGKEKPAGFDEPKLLVKVLGAEAALRAAPIVLYPLPVEFIAELKSEDAMAKGRLRIGLARELEQRIVVNGQESSAGQWNTLLDGTRVWSVVLSCPGAVGVRVHVESIRLPAGARMLVYEAAGDSPGAAPIPAEEVEGKSEIWLPTVFADKVILECQVPAGVKLSEVTFSVNQVSHLYRSLWGQAATSPNAPAKDSSCENDVSCYPAWQSQASGVALIHFQDAYNSYACTGALLNDGDTTTYIDYFLTANHCISSQAEASTVECFWFYQTPYCHAGAPSQGSVPRTSGADYLISDATSDFCLLRLQQHSPAGTHYLGWTTAGPSVNETLTCIHHPDDGYKRISFSRLDRTWPDFWTVRWYSGVTEPGSSGSPLFNAAGQIIGQLYGGPSSCSNPNGTDDYGRFDVTYESIRPWISPLLAKFSPTAAPVLNGSTADSITLAAGAPLSGSVSYSVNNDEHAPGRIVTVIGFVNSFGQNVGGTPQVIYDGTPGVATEAGTASWSNLSAPTIGGTYKLRFKAFLGVDPANCINAFASNPPLSDTGRMAGLIATVNVPATYPWTLWWQNTSGQAALWSMDGANVCSFQQMRVGPGPASSGWNVVGVADFDGNGSADLLWQHDNGWVAAWLMDGTNILRQTRLGPLPAGAGWQVTATGDLDGDGQTDILWQHTTGVTAVWFMRGTNFLSSARLNATAASTGWRMVGAGDVDGDGHLDLLWQHTSGATAVWFMNGLSRIGTQRLNAPPAGTGWRIVGTADLYNEGHTDLLWQQTDGTIAYWLMNGIDRTGAARFNPSRVDPSWRIVGPK